MYFKINKLKSALFIYYKNTVLFIFWINTAKVRDLSFSKISKKVFLVYISYFILRQLGLVLDPIKESEYIKKIK